MKPIRTAIPRTADAPIESVVSRVAEALEILQGGRGPDPQRAVRLYELIDAGVVQRLPDGTLRVNPGMRGGTGPVGPQGPAGPAGPPINFAYGDASPATIFTVPSDSEVVSVQLQIEVAFNGVGAQVLIGTSAQPGLLFDGFHSDPTVPGVYEATPRVQLAAGTQILLTITPGTGASAGTGQIILQTIPIS